MSEPALAISTPSSAGELRLAARTLAEAFLDDPVWTAIGPRRRRHRALTNRLSFWAIIKVCARQGARIRLAWPPTQQPGERPLGATIALDPGGWPLPDVSLGWELPWALAAGPAPVRRGLGLERAMRQAHIGKPHVYLWFVGVDPRWHGAGAGMALMDELHAHADGLGMAAYLEASSAANVGFYEALGYRVLGRLEGAGGARMWRMERPPSPGATRAGEPTPLGE